VLAQDRYVHMDADVVVVGGGSAGSVAAIEAQRRLPQGRVVLLVKAHVERSGAIAIGMDGLNNAILPGHATPEGYVKEITMANDGIVNQEAVLAYATRSFAMIEELDRWGVKFQKTETGDFDVKKVHHKGQLRAPHARGLRSQEGPHPADPPLGGARAQPGDGHRLLTDGGRIAGLVGLDVRDGRVVVVVSARAVILCCGAWGCRRRGTSTAR
jgi:succinate dehydrogenase/fumarate reductase flavoprotein subunit